MTSGRSRTTKQLFFFGLSILPTDYGPLTRPLPRSETRSLTRYEALRNHVKLV